MTTAITKIQSGIKFSPTVEEQVKLSDIRDKNVLLSYSKEEGLYRLVTLVVLLFISKKTATEERVPRVMFLTKRNIQKKVKKKLKETLDKTTTIHNGSILPIARKRDYERFNFIISTPKTLKNDFKDSFFSPDHFSLVFIDYAEVGSSSSTLRYLTEKLENVQLIGLSKERNKDKLICACNNLKLEEVVKVENEILPTKRSKIQHYFIPLPQEYFIVLGLLDQIVNNELKHLQNLGFSVTPKSTLREITAIHACLIDENNTRLLVKTANLQRIINLRKIIISEGFPSAVKYFEGLEERVKVKESFIGKKSIQVFLTNQLIRKLSEYLTLLKNLQHPKLRLLLKLVDKYQNGIAIATNNQSNAIFLQEIFNEQNISCIHLPKPISTYSPLLLEKALSSYDAKTIQICIANSANQILARFSKIIIAYDLSADIFNSLNSLDTSIPRIFLIAKQTSEDARFNHLKNLGQKSDFNTIDIKEINAYLRN